MTKYEKKKCTVCKTRTANFKEIGTRGCTHCSLCKKENMVDIQNRKCPCGKTAFYNHPGATATHCVKCKEDGMVDVKSKKCTEDGCRKNPGKYTKCAIHRGSKMFAKELAVLNFVKEHFQGVLHNPKIDTHMSWRKPDILILPNEHSALIVEIDEKQHHSVSRTHEDLRVQELVHALGRKRVVVVRFNPDGYHTPDRSVRFSPWKKQKGDHIVVDHVEWNARLSALKTELEHCLMMCESSPSCSSEYTVKYMFYTSLQY